MNETAQNWYNETMADYDSRAEEERRFQEFRKTPAYQECLQHGFERACADTDRVVEAIGPDGIQYPFDTNMLMRSEERRKDIRKGMNGFDALLYRNVAHALITKDETLLGKIIMDHARAYLMKHAEEFARENWQAWAESKRPTTMVY